MISFNMGVPTGRVAIVVEGFGLCLFRKHHENGDIDIYVGDGRTFTISGTSRWRYAK